MAKGPGLSNDHYVPQFLLRHFALSGGVYVYDKLTRRKFRTNPRNIMGERGYNSVTLKGGAWVEFEHKFTHVESLAKPALSQLIETESVASLSDDQRAALFIFMVVQHLRARTIRDDFLAIGPTIRDRFPGAKTNDLPEFMDDDAFEKFAFLKGTLDDLTPYVAPLVLKHLFLMKWTGRRPIYISDNPLVMRNERDFGPYGNIGLAVPGIEIYFPISPTLVIGLLCPTTVAAMRRDLYDAEQILREMVPADPEHTRPETRTTHDLIIKTRDHHRHIFGERLLIIDEDNLKYLNSLQLQWAKRHIVAANDDFSFADLALAERPEWILHPTLKM